MTETTAGTEARLAAPTGVKPLLRGPLGRALLRPPFDWLAVRVVARVFLRLSRAWAAAQAAGEDRQRFLTDSGLASAGGWFGSQAKLEKVLASVAAKATAHAAAEDRWLEAFFGDASLDARTLAACETARREAAHHLMACRLSFLSNRRRLAPVRWELPGVDDVEAEQGARLADPANAFPLPDMPAIETSRVAEGAYGAEYWLRFPSPAMGDQAWAHVYEPAVYQSAGRRDAPTAIFLHGIAMETEMWRDHPGAVPALAERGFRVIAAEGPWHGRRCPPGYYGGEPILGRGPLGLIELLEAWVAEVSVLIRWARATGSGPVALTGVSLGALTSQKAASAAVGWPEGARPDALMLVATSGSLLDLAGTGSLARQTGLGAEIRKAGWRDEDLSRWLPLMEPDSQAPLDPDHLLMVLGAHDDLTPYPGGQALAEDWKVPPENFFLRPQGHFSVSLGVLSDPLPLDRLKAVMETL